MPTNAAGTGFWTAMPGGSRVNNARQGRALLQGIYANNDTTPLNGVRSGVLPTTWDVANLRFTDLVVTVTSGLTMAVAPGLAVAHRSGQGPYEGWLLSAASITCDAAPATNPRNDIVVARWYDTVAGDTLPASGDPFKIEIITGTPGAVPVDPVTWNSLGVITSFPAQTGSGTGGIGVPLARAQVSTGGAITLTRLRRGVGIVGATRPLMEGDSDSGGKVGDTRYNPTGDVFEVKRSDGNWASLPKGVIARGFVTTNSATGQPVGVMRLDSVPLLSGRMYHMYTNNTTILGTANETVALDLRYNTAGTATTGSAQMPGARHQMKLINGGGAAAMFRCDTVYVPASDQTASIIVTGELSTGSNNLTVIVDSQNFLSLTVEDIGVAPSNTAVDL